MRMGQKFPVGVNARPPVFGFGAKESTRAYHVFYPGRKNLLPLQKNLWVNRGKLIFVNSIE
jgi:hypothetical protein